MAKSLKNTINIAELLAKYTSNQFRMAYLLSHYRSYMHFNDARAKYHIPADYPYIAYFVAQILESGQYIQNDPSKPLHKCDIYESLAAGKRIPDGLSLGLSKHWSDVLSILTGERELKADALLEYLAPLHEFLINENEKMSMYCVPFLLFEH